MMRMAEDVRRVARTLRSLEATRSTIEAKLIWLMRSAPHRPGVFDFPFGRVAYVDRENLYWQYRQIFIDRIYEVLGLGEAPSIIDCGGNIGLSTIWFKQRYPRASITTIEADPRIVSVLRRNVQALSAVRVIHGAVGSAIGTTTFLPDGRDSGRVSQGEGITVPALRLSGLVTNTVDILKIDIEGSEFDVIFDLHETDTLKHIRSLICEIHGRLEVQEKLPRVWDMLSRAGFRLTVSGGVTAPYLPGAADPTPFSHVQSATFLLNLYAWQP